MTMLSPLPRSTAISPGTPRKACITRRWTFSVAGSVTGEFLEQLTDGLRSIRMACVQDLLEPSSEIRRQIVHGVEQCLKKLLRAWTGHRETLLARRKGEYRRV